MAGGKTFRQQSASLQSLIAIPHDAHDVSPHEELGVASTNLSSEEVAGQARLQCRLVDWQKHSAPANNLGCKKEAFIIIIIILSITM